MLGCWGWGETPPVGLLGLGEAPHVGLLELGETPPVGLLGLGEAPHVGLLGPGETPHVGLLGLGETPHVGLLGETPHVGVRMMTLKPLSRCALLHGQSLSQAVAVFLQKAVLSVVLDCLASCPWQGLLVTDAKNKKCCSLTAVLLTC